MEQSVAGLFSNRHRAADAMNRLLGAGIRRQQISMIARGETHDDLDRAWGETSSGDITPAKGAMLGTAAGLAVAAGALAIPGVGPVVAAGPIATALTSMGFGAVTGGLLGALRDEGIEEDDAHMFAEGVRQGGTLLIVHCDVDRTEEIEDLMRHSGATEIEENIEHEAGSERSKAERSDESRTLEGDDINADYPGLPASSGIEDRKLHGTGLTPGQKDNSALNTSDIAGAGFVSGDAALQEESGPPVPPRDVNEGDEHFQYTESGEDPLSRTAAGGSGSTMRQTPAERLERLRKAAREKQADIQDVRPAAPSRTHKPPLSRGG